MTNIPESNVLPEPSEKNTTTHHKNSVPKTGTRSKKPQSRKEEKTGMGRHPLTYTKRTTVRTSSTENIHQYYRTPIYNKVHKNDPTTTTETDQTKKEHHKTKIPAKIVKSSSGNEQNQSKMETGIMKYLVRIWTKIKSK